MIDRRDLITICRQIGTMMEVGVDFLRITRVLREQTDNPRLLMLYDDIEQQMRDGKSLTEALEIAPDVFSPFAISIIERGDMTGDIAGSWHRLADHFKEEAQQVRQLGASGLSDFEVPARDANIESATSGTAIPVVPPTESVVNYVAGFLLAMVALSGASALGYVSARWFPSLALLIGALFLLAFSWFVLRRASHASTRENPAIPATPVPSAAPEDDDPFAV